MQLPATVISVFVGWFGGVKESEPLHAAARTGNIVQAHLVLMRCPNAVNISQRFTKERCPTPVHLAAYWNNVGVLELLLARGGKVNDPGASGETPLQHAASRGSTATANALLKHGATLDIFSAVSLNRWNEVQLWLRAASLLGWQKRLANARSDGPGWGSTPLLNWAIQGGHLRMVELLVRHGAEVNPYADPKVTLDNSPLHNAVYKRRPDIAVFLIENGAKINAQDYDGYTALHRAVLYDDVGMVRVLLKHGASPNTRQDWFRPRACAPNGDTRTFFTPLHTAAQNESPELVALLLAHGAPLGVRAADGRTPLDVAATIEPQWDSASFSHEPGKLTSARVLCIILLRCAGAPAGALPHR